MNPIKLVSEPIRFGLEDLMSSVESIGDNIMVTNAKLERKVDDQEEENRLLKEKLVELESKLGAIETKVDEVLVKVGGEEGKGKEVLEIDKVCKPDPILEQEPFPKALKALSGKSLEGLPLFTGKMEVEVVLEWIEGMENHFECERITEAQRVKVAKYRMRGVALTWWKFVQDERKKMGKAPISS